MPSNYDKAFIFQLYFFVPQSCQGLTVYAACKQLLTNGFAKMCTNNLTNNWNWKKYCLIKKYYYDLQKGSIWTKEIMIMVLAKCLKFVAFFFSCWIFSLLAHGWFVMGLMFGLSQNYTCYYMF